MSSPQKQALLRKKMDGPTVPWTVGDAVLRVGGNNVFMTYHAAVTPWALATPVGCVLGAAGWYLSGISSSKKPSSLLSSMATTGMILGGVGMTVGLTRRTILAVQGDQAKAKIPWTAEGIQQRVDGLSHNFKVRILDVSAWNGVTAGALALAVAGGSPAALGLAPGAWGLAQVLTLASSVGSLSGIACIYSVEQSKNAALAEED